MNRLEELLTILSEECAEVSQAASKCVRFGMESEYQGRTNRQRLESELGDLLAMFKLILQETNLSEEAVMNAAEAKLIKVEKFMRNQKGKTPAEMVESFSKNPLPPLPPPARKRSRRRIGLK